jgi:hypothetical protein
MFVKNNNRKGLLDLKKSLYDFIKHTDIRILKGILWTIFAVLVFLHPIAVYLVVDNSTFQDYDGSWALAPAFLILSLSGVVSIIKREFYVSPFLKIKGKWAIFWGVVATIVYISFGVLGIILN